MARLQNLPDIDHEFQNLRISAIRKAVKIAPFVYETTIGPRSAYNFNNTENTDALSNNKKITNGDNQPQPIRKKLNRTAWKTFQAASNNNTVPIEKILHECQVQKNIAATCEYDSILTNMTATRTEMMSKFWHRQELEYEKRAQYRRNREIEVLQEMATEDRIAKLEEQKLDAENRAHSERMKKLLEKQLESAKLFEQLNTNHVDIFNLYKKITNMPCSDKTVYSKVLQKYDANLFTILSSMNSIIENCKLGSISKEAVQKTIALTTQMQNLKTVIFDEINSTINAAAVAAQKILEESKKQAETPPTPPEIPQTKPHELTKANKDSPVKLEDAPTKVQFCSEQSLKRYLELKQFSDSYRASYQPLLDDVSTKKFRFDCQKAVNTPVNAIASVSGLHLKDKYDKLLKLLNGDKVIVGDISVSAAQHPLGKAYCTDLLARKIVRQGELLVSSNPEAAFPIASVIISLWARFPDFGKLICAHFNEDCPFIIPMMMPQQEGQSIEDFYKCRGYRYNEDGTIEKQDKFLKRMSGIFRLYAAIWVTKMPRNANAPHPQSLSHAWRWLAAFANLEPEVDISATLIFDFLTVCGSEFFKYYKSQFVKILKFLMSDYTTRLQKIDEGGPKTRLEVFMQNIIKDGRLHPPTGMLSENFW